MCLTKLHEQPKNGYPKFKYGYKVFTIHKNFLKSLYFSNLYGLESNEIYIALKTKRYANSDGPAYTTGFHAYINLKDAQKTLRSAQLWLPDPIIKRVKIYDIMYTGIDIYNSKCIVGGKMKIMKGKYNVY